MLYIKDFGSRYFAKSDGRIFAKKHSVEISNQTGKTGKYKELPERELKGSVNTTGYRQVFVDGVTRCVHVIIAEVFIPNPLNLPQVNHINGVKLDCSIANLEWITPSDNLKHSYSIGLSKKKMGEENNNSKLTKDIVEEIYLLAVKGAISQKEIGNKFGIPQITVSNIKTKKTWSHITDALDVH